MKRSELKKELVKIYSTRPEGCSDYDIVCMLLSAAQKRGMQMVRMGMNRSELLKQLVKIYSTTPDGFSDCDIVHMFVYALEQRGMKLVQEVQVSSGTSNSEGGEDWYMDIVIGFEEEDEDK